ncbi:homocysteine-responsive endoplasmic reticulum-resident ubiquitin-like domain member 2 protein isoform X2 [Clavelina lepadiformis]|uniref:Ubiquitin-like domain-containing protein n=1 Tax=Clavelina lepadiformis TaxID=159417 RepID=A0ABP0GV24_CLALP
MSDNWITITIRTPTHHNDHPVACDPNWSVLTLKQILSESYPGKPEVKSQRLIYGGKYLKDHDVLKTVLKETNYQQIVHLVLSIEASSSQHETLTTNQSSPQLNEASSSEIRHRRMNSSPSDPTNRSHWTPQQLAAYYQQHAYPGYMQQPHQHPQYTEMLRQYQEQMNHYMQHYWSHVNNTGVSQTSDVPVPPAQEQIPENAPVAAPANAPPANPPMNAQGGAFGAALDDEDMQQDWLDLLFVFVRYLFFFSILYFYSDWWRFLFVASLALIIYIYQAGVFRAARRPPHPDDLERRNDGNAPVERPNTPQDDNNNSNNSDGTTPETSMEAAPPSIFATAWCFVSTFFSSLIPQPPPVV